MSEVDKFIRRLHAVVQGRVQGVNFRSFTRRAALERGLRGWVRNLSDGTVEVVAEGPEEALTQFEEFLHNGSPAASVSKVTTNWTDATSEFSDFQIRYF